MTKYKDNKINISKQLIEQSPLKRTHIARLLGISYRTLIRKAKTNKLTMEQYQRIKEVHNKIPHIQ